jgi:AcrR family transcriptional regulator
MGADAGRAGAGDDRAAAESEPPQYLVERGDRRDASRRRVEKIALSMFAEHGFGEVTVTEICARAQVAPATFYRYFGSKEGVIFLYEEEFLAIGRAIGRSVDPNASSVDQVREMLERCSAFFERQSEIRVLRDEIVLSNEALVRRTFAVERRFEDVLATALASARRESEPTVGTLLDAAVCMAVQRLALIRWRYSQDASLAQISHAIYDSLRGRLA